MLSQRLVEGRASAYACCSEYYEALATKEAIYGDAKEAACLQRKALLFLWGSDVMQRTPFEEDEDRGCVTDAFALAVINKLDQDRCVTCKCGDRPITCVITPDFTVFMAVDASYELSADPNQFYLIKSNLNSLTGGWADHVGEIAKVSAYTVPDPGDIVYDASLDDFYVRNDQSETTELFPRLDATLDGTDLTVTSRAPNTSVYMDRNCVVEISSDATNFTAIYSGSESVFDPSEVFTVPDDTLYIRTTYYTQDLDCSYGPFAGLLVPDTVPPLPIRSFSFDTGSFLGPVPPQLLPFNFAGAPTWMIGFWYRSNSPGGIPYNAPFLGQATDGTTISTGSTTGSDFGISWTDTGGGGGTYLNATANDTLSDGNWHHVAFVRSVLNTAVSPAMYLDGISFPLVATPTGIGTAGGADMSIYIGDTSSFVTGPFHMGQVYACSTALTQSQVLNVIMQNIMSNSDGTFGRLFWYQPSLTDNLTASPYVDGNQAGSPQLVASGAVTFDTVDLPPIGP